MAIDNIKAYAHLSDADIEEIGRRLDQIKAEVTQSLGARDVAYIKRLIRTQRSLEAAGRFALLFAGNKKCWWLGTGLLSTAKILENLEIGHNVLHGQWDWMNDPEIHSTTWEWDIVCPSSQWMHSHNFVHHTYTNVLGMDNDVGYGILRVTRDRKWTALHAFQPAVNTVLAAMFQWAVGYYDVELGRYLTKRADWNDTKDKFWETTNKAGRQLARDYVFYPALAGKAFPQAVKANAVANLVRSVWAYSVIFCGHFPDEAETFTKEQFKNEDHNQWYLRQMLGSANFYGGKLLTIMSGNLNYQIEHHLFPDMPSNRLAEVGEKVRALCDEFDLPYNVDSFPAQLFKVQKTLLKLTLPNKYLVASPDNAPEVRSNRAFSQNPEIENQLAGGNNGSGLRTGLKLLKRLRPSIKDAILIYSGRKPRGNQQR
ncbi:fatty acid desaturase family protein [Corynebacterium diphtheriae]|uniref:fatty acid desaturase family protein n=1 Tax=Corynebacterium diphtheriae TaxID=1717 RepID=UPI00064C6272|nr:acyl-CoA desaturase [Corynebacterium diphtheriae]OWN08159.1 fatty acid desaturase [Corynebacterium belfantii]KLN41201.1 fatty acid desaturase [Corynebacterium diphtheriae bv. gravis str. ISS 4060]MBG9263333.1 acyl-CoA desaturase [Corynebacterium diphtheriae bv. gravis]OWM49164.1 acyl-CoA desaturase [Corynebacterium diphtheriae]OWM53695.1 acyl-CoA desaturase [Corynebacterium diphtheriae]